MRTKGLLTFAVVTLMCVVGWTAYGQKKSPTPARWEYARAQIKLSDDSTLSRLGEQGWELVAIDANELYVFKRQVNR